MSTIIINTCTPYNLKNDLYHLLVEINFLSPIDFSLKYLVYIYVIMYMEYPYNQVLDSFFRWTKFALNWLNNLGIKE